MKKMPLVFIASMLLLPVVSMAQSRPQPPPEWVAFQKQESAKRAAFNQQIKADTQAFLSSHPEMQTYFAEMQAASKARYAQWKAMHQRP